MKEDLLVVHRNSSARDYIINHAVRRGSVNNLWFRVKDKWINTGDRTCVIGPDIVPSNFTEKPIYSGMLSLDRNIVEDDWQFQQIVVGLIIHSSDKMFLLKCDKGDMKDQLTLIQGHVTALPVELETFSFSELLERNISREVCEEVRVRKPSMGPAKKVLIDHLFKMDDIKYRPRLKFMTYNVTYPDTCIADYHIGYIYDIFIDDKNDDFFYMLESNEPEKNTAFVYDMHDPTPETADSWVREIIDYYKKYTGIK